MINVRYVDVEIFELELRSGISGRQPDRAAGQLEGTRHEVTALDLNHGPL
jgi:hypothetical protein